MTIFDINGKEINIRISKNDYNDDSVFRSKLQTVAYEYIKDKFPYEVIVQDFVIPNSRMSVDFFIPRVGIVIEINGGQHYQFTRFVSWRQKIFTKIWPTKDKRCKEKKLGRN